MKERDPLFTKERCFKAADVAFKETVRGTAMCVGGAAGLIGIGYLSEGRYIDAVFPLLATGGVILADRMVVSIEKKRIAMGAYVAGHRDGMRMGARIVAESMAMSEIQPVPFNLPENGEPIYRSLDGNVEIKDPHELITRIGDPRKAIIRTGVILGHAGKRPLTTNEVEQLRIIKATIGMVPDAANALWDRGQEVVGKINTVVGQYEEVYTASNPQSSNN